MIRKSVHFGIITSFNDMKYRKFDLSAGVGASYKIAGRIEVSARYNAGLIKLTKDIDTRNNTFRFGVGYRF